MCVGVCVCVCGMMELMFLNKTSKSYRRKISLMFFLFFNLYKKPLKDFELIIRFYFYVQ